MRTLNDELADTVVEDFSLDELTVALRSMAVGKSCGTKPYSMDLFMQNEDTTLLRCVLLVFNQCKNHGVP